MAIIFSKLVGKNEPLYGKFEHPIKALIQNESNALEKKKTLLDVLFNVEKSNRYAETTMGQTDFDTFQSVKEGAGAENDSIELAFKKTIEHIPFMKEFTITKEMADDSKMGLGANVKAKPKGFVRAYYKTRTKLAAWALAHATETGGKFNKAYVDLTTGDGKLISMRREILCVFLIRTWIPELTRLKKLWRVSLLSSQSSANRKR